MHGESDKDLPAGTQALIEKIADAAAEGAVRETFKQLGVDVRDQTQLNEFRSDLVYSRKLRRISDRMVPLLLVAIVIGALGIAWGLLSEGMKAWIQGGRP